MTFKISQYDMLPKESEMAEWVAHAPSECPRDAVLKAEFWVHVAKKIAANSVIHVFARDGSWYAKHLVRFVDGKDVRVHELEFHQLDSLDLGEDEHALYKVEWGGPKHKWRVVRKSDGEVLQHSFATRQAASIHMHKQLPQAA